MILKVTLGSSSPWEHFCKWLSSFVAELLAREEDFCSSVQDWIERRITEWCLQANAHDVPRSNCGWAWQRECGFRCYWWFFCFQGQEVRAAAVLAGTEKLVLVSAVAGLTMNLTVRSNDTFLSEVVLKALKTTLVWMKTKQNNKMKQIFTSYCGLGLF